MAFGLVFDGQAFDIEGAWKHNRSLRRLRSTIRTRGESRIIEGVEGRTPYVVLKDEIVVDLELMVYGVNDGTGTPHSDVLEGLDENLAYLEDFVYDHTDQSAATWTAVLETVSGRTFEAQAQILNWQIAQENVTQVVVGYDLRIPAGVWTETTPP